MNRSKKLARKNLDVREKDKKKRYKSMHEWCSSHVEVSFDMLSKRCDPSRNQTYFVHSNQN